MGRKWGRTREIFEASMNDIERDFEGGAELREIAAKYEVSAPTITNWLITAGYKHRRKGRYPIAMKEKAAELFNRGWDPVGIGKLLRVKLPYIEQWVGIATEPTREVLGRDVAPVEAPEGMRHKVGRRWTDEQKRRIYGFLQAPEVFTVATIYTLTGASRKRQQKIWREFSDAPFPLPKKRRERPAAPTKVAEGEGMSQDDAEAFELGRRAGVEEAERGEMALREAFEPDLIAEFERGRLAGLEEARSIAVEATEVVPAIQGAIDERQLALPEVEVEAVESPPEAES